MIRFCDEEVRAEVVRLMDEFRKKPRDPKEEDERLLSLAEQVCGEAFIKEYRRRAFSSLEKVSVTGSVSPMSCLRKLYGKKVLHREGEGAFGTVFKIGRGRVVKALHVLADDPDRITREIELGSRAGEAGLAPRLFGATHCTDEAGESIVLLEMEAMDATLYEWMDAKTRSAKAKARMAAAVNDRLKRLKEDAKIIHLDVYPSNIMVKKGKPYVVDFGLARGIGEGDYDPGDLGFVYHSSGHFDFASFFGRHNVGKRGMFWDDYVETPYSREFRYVVNGIASRIDTSCRR